jgi:hypothetical protein
VIIASNAAPARCSMAAMVAISFSKRSQHLDGQLLQAPVTLGRSRRRFAHISDAASLAACLNVCLPVPASLIDKDPHSLRLSGWPSGHLLRCSLNGVLPQTQRIPCLTGLNPRALDPQTSAAWPRTSSGVQFSLEIRVLELGAFRRIKLMVVKMTVRPIAKLSE